MPSDQPIADLTEVKEMKNISRNGLEIEIGGSVKISAFIDFVKNISDYKHASYIVMGFKNILEKKN